MGQEGQGSSLRIPEIDGAGIDGRNPTGRVQQPVRGLLQTVGGAESEQEIARDPDSVRVPRCVTRGGCLAAHIALLAASPHPGTAASRSRLPLPS